MNSPSPTAAEICDHLGRKEISVRVGRGITAVSNAASVGVFPASWYAVVRAMCIEKGLSCPESLFSFVPPTLKADCPDQTPTREEDAA